MGCISSQKWKKFPLAVDFSAVNVKIFMIIGKERMPVRGTHSTAKKPCSAVHFL